jgi:two-component system probable response regulator PhcQ
MTENSPASDFSVLFVDDEEMALKYFRRAVGAEVTVHTAASVDEALAILGEHGDEIGVLVTDQRMPGKTGVDLLRHVRRERPEIVRLLTTAYSDLEDAIEAVNRGEIFRYITKPWDVKLLRAELRQAMELFELRREHALLMAEKLSVWQRLVAVNRIRDLAVMAGSFVHLRNATAAVAAYFEHGAPGHPEPRLAAAEALDLWRLTEREIARTLGVVDSLSAATDGADIAQFSQRIAVDRLLDGAEISGGGGAEVTVHPGLAARLGSALLSLTGDRPRGAATPAELDGQDAVSLRLEAGPVVADSAEPLLAYLIVHHHGGTLAPAPGGDGWTLTLPVNPAAAATRKPREDWLERTLARLEQWD